MAEMYRITPTFIVVIASLFTAVPAYAETKMAAPPNWYLVDEIIKDSAPDYRSDIFFADKASVHREDGYTSISISQIIITEDAETPKAKIRDLRSHILIDCNEHIYAPVKTSEFDREGKLVTSQTMSLETAEWILPYANSGYVNIFRFACEPETEFGTQKFPGHIQPLTSLMAYMNADWSK